MIAQKVSTPKSPRIFYGWIALAGVMLVQFAGVGVFFYSYSVFLPIMSAEFGWGRGVVATGLSLGLLLMGLPGPIVGAFISRFGARAAIVWGNLLVVIGVAAMSLTQQAWHVYLFYSFAGFGAAFGGYIACTSVVNNWFIKKRSLAIGIFSTAAGLGGFAFPPLATVLIASIGWRHSWAVLAGLLLIFISLFAGLLLIRNKPEDKGLLPDGAPAGDRNNDIAGSLKTAGKQSEWKISQVLKHPTIWMITLFAAVNSFTFQSLMAHQVAYIRDLGFTPMTAAMTLSLAAGCNLFGGLGLGILASRFNLKVLAVSFFLLRLLAIVIILTTSSLYLIFLYAILVGISFSALSAAMMLFVATYFERSHYAQVMGVTFMGSIAAGAVGPVVAGTVYDATGTYTPAFFIALCASLVGFASIFLIRPGKWTHTAQPAK